MAFYYASTCLVMVIALAHIAHAEPAAYSDAQVDAWPAVPIYQVQLQQQLQQLQQNLYQGPQYKFVQPMGLDNWSTRLVYLNAVPGPFTQYALVPTNVPDRTLEPINTTPQPTKKDIEPTTSRPSSSLKAGRPSKIQADFTSDTRLLNSVRKINKDFVIEEIVPAPGKHILAQISREPAKKSKVVLQKFKNTNKKMATPSIKVEATGNTATSGTVPEISFNTYFLPYLADQQTGQKPAALILEPHAKAVVGNGGTAISAPISRAVLKRGVPTNVYFNPESVAIAGVGGKAHAQADLELDLLNRRR